MTLKRIGALVILGCLCLTMTACGGESSTTPTLPSVAVEVKGYVGAEGASTGDTSAEDVGVEGARRRQNAEKGVERGLADPSQRTLYTRNTFASRGLDLLKSWPETFFSKIKETEKITFEHLLFIPIVAILHFLIGW